MAIPIMNVNQTPPDRMTPEQRRTEVATLLARGLVRLRTKAEPLLTATLENEFELAFPAGQSVHGDSNNNIIMESE